MEGPGPGKGKRRRGDGKTLQEIALSFIQRDGVSGICRIAENDQCSYVQETLDVGNFIRHFRTQHTDAAVKCGLLNRIDLNTKKPRIVTKRPMAIDIPLYMDSISKLVAYNHLPLCFVEWEGMEQLFDPISAALGITVNKSHVKMIIHSVAVQIRAILSGEMKNRLLSLKIDSASRFNRHILGINVQYFLDSKIVIRTLGMIEIKDRQTAALLKTKILEILQTYGVTVKQIFSVTCDNAANMLAAVRKLKQEFDFIISLQLENEINLEDTENKETEPENEIDTEVVENNRDRDLSEALSTEFHQDQLNLVPCSVHSLQLVILDVVEKSDESVKEITAVAKNCKSVKYKTHFDYHNASLPPVWGQTR
ncbi:uncharacterized protein LOC129774722 [Toxorhynchites rutilus septentrionalis]|uniref:uncharacterized protein LOC129774722 n=1 Tax=Toxorhynchites rutilus septentrionalis TaxID=329112 RepID=UPI00247882E8|nr:uncharacterized protein LOC129774722 [Toxorhynchites rutilus septentrionalis]